MKKEINVFDYANDILAAFQKGVLLTSKSNDFVNTMTISWGSLGIEWGKPIFTVYVRENRLTKLILDENPEFTINVPFGDFDRKILEICGTKSGKDTNKIEAANLTLEPANIINVPGIRQLPLTLECKIIYKQAQDPTQISQENLSKYYPQDVDSSFHSANRDFHTAYYGQIVSAYIIED